jgi:hypothetical protein
MRRWYALVMILASVAALLSVVVVSVAYTRHVQQQADHRWCSLLGTLDSPSVPTTTDRGRVVQQQIHTLRVQLECPK